MQINNKAFNAAAKAQSQLTGERKVIVMPGEAKSLDDARNIMVENQDFFEATGLDDARAIMKNAGLAGSVTADEQKKLEAAGFQVIDDKPTKAEPQAQVTSVKQLSPGWFFDRFPLLEGPYNPFPGFRPRRPRREIRRPVRRIQPKPVEKAKGEAPTDYIGDLKATGKGVTIAVLDSGVSKHPDLGDRLLGNIKLVGGRARFSSDPVGHGTHVAGDAAGDGTLSNGRIQGPAPDANIIGVQLLGDDASASSLSSIMDKFAVGIDWMVNNKEKYNIGVANLSLGVSLASDRDRYGQRYLFDPIGASIQEALKAGIIVVAAAGNDGPNGRINQSPGMIEEVITVGALDTNGTPQDKRDDRVASFSSRGRTPEGLMKPDIIAPGVNIVATNAPDGSISQENERAEQMLESINSASTRELQGMMRDMVRSRVLPYDALDMHPEDFRELMKMGFQTKATYGELDGGSAYIAMDGTSMASPIVAGVVASMLEVNPNLSQQQVKAILMKTADPLRGEPRTAQGAGAIDAQEALQWAEALAQRDTQPTRRRGGFRFA